MHIDLNAVKSLLSLNGLTLENSDDDIRALLARANYTPEETETVIATLRGAPAVTPITPRIPAIPAPTTPVPSITTPLPPPDAPAAAAMSGMPSQLLAPQPGLYEKVAGPLFAILAYVTFALYLLGPLRLSEGVTPETVALFTSPTALLYVVPISLVLAVVSWFIARTVNRTTAFAFRLSTLVCVFALLWFTILYGVAATISGSGIADILGLILGYALRASAVLIAVLLVLALPFTLYMWRPKKPRQTRLVPTIIAILGICVLTYFSGALGYPARALKLNFLCVAVAGKSAQESCRALSYVVPSSSSEYETIPTAVPLNNFAMIGGHFYALSDSGGGGYYHTIYVDGVLDTRYKNITAPLIDAGGKAVFTADDVATGKRVLVVGEEEKTGYIGYGSLTPTADGDVAFVGVKADRNSVVVSGNRVLGASLGVYGVSQQNGLVALPNGSVLYKFYKKTAEVSLGGNAYVALDDTLLGGPYDSVYLFVKDGKPGYSFTGDGVSKTIVDGKEVPYVTPPPDPSENDGRLVRKDDGFYLDGKYIAPSQNAYSSALIDGKFIIGGVDLAAPRMVNGYYTPHGFLLVQKGLLSDDIKARLAAPAK